MDEDAFRRAIRSLESRRAIQRQAADLRAAFPELSIMNSEFLAEDLVGDRLKGQGEPSERVLAGWVWQYVRWGEATRDRSAPLLMARIAKELGSSRSAVYRAHKRFVEAGADPWEAIADVIRWAGEKDMRRERRAQLEARGRTRMAAAKWEARHRTEPVESAPKPRRLQPTLQPSGGTKPD